jgi:hypothetical protein
MSLGVFPELLVIDLIKNQLPIQNDIPGKVSFLLYLQI